MSDEKAEYEKMKALHMPALLEHEGGKPLVFLPGITFRAGGKSHTGDLLLHPNAGQGSYQSRLFFREKVPGSQVNWQEPQTILGRPWWVYSWRDVPSTMSWPNMLCEHLRALA